MWAEMRHRPDIMRDWYSGGQGTNVTELCANRWNPRPRACSISVAKIRATGAVVTFTWAGQDGSHHEDCLDLAEQAVNAWSVFLRSLNLRP